MALKVGAVDKLILFGGGMLLARIAKEAIKRGIETHVFAVKRHLEEIIDTENKLRLIDVLERGGIPYYLEPDINRSAKLRKLMSARTMGIGLGETYTFNRDTLALFKGKIFDFMVIRLPQYRGGAHFTWQILRKDRIGCWNIQVINEEMVPGVYDSGAILKTKEYTIPKRAKTPKQYFTLCENEGLKLFIGFINDIGDGKGFKLRHLDESKSLYLPRLHTLKHAFINWDWDLEEIERFICAFDDPYPGAATFLNGKKVFMKDCRADYRDGAFHPFISGIIYRILNDDVYIAAKDGTLVVKKVLDEKQEKLAKIKVGQRFYTPLKFIEAAMLFNAEYDGEGLVNNNNE